MAETNSITGDVVAEQNVDWAESQKSHWAWQPVKLPEVRSTDINSATDIDPIAESQHLIDAFVLTKRNAAEIQAEPPADPAIMVRQIYLDPNGILPTPQQFANCVVGDAAYRDKTVAELVDELLASPL